MKKVLTFITLLAVISACGGQGENSANEANRVSANSKLKKTDDVTKGIGKFKDVELPPTLDQAKATAGEKIYEVKCQPCHKLTDVKLVGPGWLGVTERRKPEWILNFITNVDEMLSNDPVAMAQLEECLVRMPNQQLTDDDAFAVLEFMRKNDGVK